jgi:hypothetical protein
MSVVITGLYLDQNCTDHPGSRVTEVPLDFLLVEMPSDCLYFNTRLWHAHINSSYHCTRLFLLIGEAAGR